jgi:hypothetical protein
MTAQTLHSTGSGAPTGGSDRTGLPVSIRRRLAAGFCLIIAFALLAPLPAPAALILSEFLAENDGGLRDADGDSPDWIEIRNDSASPANLAGWHLTDDPADLTKWTFPATNLASGGFLVVFASGKNRASAGAELHTNFRLENSGGYLALVAPDGTSLAQAVSYPAQRANVSFGPGRAVNATTLLSTGATARVFVPADGGLGQSWTARVFNDSSWFSSNAPVGFNAAATTTPLLALDFNERGVNPDLITQPGFTPFLSSSNGSVTAIQTQATTRVFGGIGVTVSNTAPLGYDDRLRATPTNSGAFTESLLLRDFIFSLTRTNEGGLDVTIEGLTPHQLHRLTIWSFDAGSLGNRVSDWSANGVPVTNGYALNGANLPTANEQYQFTFDAAADGAGRIWLAGRRSPASVSGTGAAEFGVFLNALRLAVVNPPPEPSGLGALMIHSNATAYLRLPFTVPDSADVSALRLRMGYNDGFVAFINGQAVASRNAPASPAWNSTATAPRTTAAVEELLVIPPPALLVAGENMLAIQGLNASAEDLTFSIAPELIAEQITELPGRYFKPPTPGAANGTGFDGLVADTKFSVNRGFFDAPFSLSITCATPGVEIRYTTNGSPASATSGFIFTSPITINRHSFIRAAAFRPGWVPSDIDTHSYIFLRDVFRQSNNIPNYPTVWQASYPADYAMDPNIVNHPVYGPALSNALRSIPTLSIVSDHNGLWGASTGIYPNSTSSGTNWERAASLELIDGGGATEFAVNARLEMHGNASRDNVRTPKHSMHVVFNSDYGPTKLRHDWFGGGVDVHNKIVFRSCGFVDGWAGRYADNGTYTSAETGETFRGLRYRPENTCYLRDAWVKDSFRDMGWVSSRSQYVHLYLNGLYWGLYQPSEAPGAPYFAEHLGGPEGAWDVLVGEDNNGPPVIVDGSGVGWTNVLNLANAGIASEAAYAAITNLVEIDNLIDYMMVHIFSESEDWPRHNWYVARRRATNGLPATRFICSVWDQELTLDRLVRDASRNRINVGSSGGEIYSPGRVYQQLRNWPEFRRQFGDRVHKHLFNGGALTPGNNVARLLGPAAIIREAVIGESSRWGDARSNGVPAGQIGTGKTFTRDEWWQPEIDKLATNFFQRLTADNVARFRSGQLYPALGAPVFNQFGGAVPAGFGLVITHTNAGGVIYFTTDGTDPRTYGTGAVAPGAQAYSAAVVLNSPTLARARVLNGGQWSALTEAAFYPPQDLSRLALTEIMYNPPALGLIDGDEFEFLELKNTGTNVLNLSGLTFIGITFTFTNGTLLAPGQFFVLAASATNFAAKYPGVAMHGVYSGRLANSGETLTLSHPLGAIILSVTFNDDVPWPLTPDNHDHSLVPKNPGLTQAPDNGADWRASANPGGSPGADDPAPAIPPVVINEILTASVPPDVDRIELFNPTGSPVDVGGWFLGDDAEQPRKFRIPNGTMISAGGFLVFTEAQFNTTPGTNGNFSLSSRGESVYLFSGDANTNLTGYSHGFAFDAAPDGATFGRHVNSVGEEQFPEQIAPSFTAMNSGPRVGPVVITEIHYHPTSGGDEFIELENITGVAIPLYDPAFPANTWRLNGLGFDLPAGVTLPANGRLLLVATNPAAFRAKYSVPASVSILGPYSGELQDSGERLKLQRPAPPDTNGPAFITVDEIRYNDKAPWPPAADGSGASLQRLNVAAYGNDPINWIASAPTPGQALDNADTDGDGLPDSWETAHGTDRLVPDADADPDNDSATNLEEYLAGTNPQSAQSLLKVDILAALPSLTTLQFPAVSNRTYSLLFKNSLDAPAWFKLRDVDSRATNWTVLVQDTTPVLTNRFYRVVTPQWP